MGETTTRRPPRRRSGRWIGLGAGVRIAKDLGEEDPLWAGMRAWAERLPDGTIFTGLTAAAAYDLCGPRLRAALALADSRSESPWESLLRVLHLACGGAGSEKWSIWARG